MKKILALVLAFSMCFSSMILLTSCDEEDDDNEVLTDAEDWDYDNDGTLDNDEREDYENYMRDAYEYEQAHADD